MPDHHVCRYPLWHRVLIWSIALVWLLLAPVGLFRVVSHLTTAPLWSFLAMVGALTPGLVLVKGLVAWRCQPWPPSRIPLMAYPLVAVSLLPKDRL